jgi:broad specificity phosphatase PhoE
MDGTAAGDIDLNVINQYVSGDRDAGLSLKGQSEIKQSAAWFKEKKIKAVYSSHLARAQESAQMFSRELNIDHHINDHLAEINVGSIDPTKSRFFNAVFTGILGAYSAAPAVISRLMFPVITRLLIYSYLFRWLAGKTTGGESIRDAFGRMNRALTDIVGQHDENAEVVIVSHGYFITLLAFQCVRRHKIDLFKLGNFFWVANGSVTMFIADGQGDLRLKCFARRV